MQTLLHQLVLNAKTKRWLILLEVLEEEEHVIAQTLSDQTGFSRRTIMKDMHAVKAYFGETIQLVGNGEGYHFSFIDPKGYYEKKQALLEEEKLFLFVDQLAAGKRIDNQQWTTFLGVSSSGFQRMKGQLQALLTQQYGLQLVAKNNLLRGEEASIRQFLYDFYFTLPLYPTVLQEHIRHLHQEKTIVQEGPWQLDATLVNQWLKLIKLRIEQGYCLPDQGKHKNLQATLVQALNQQVNVALPASEKAALFLLSLDEGQFLSPLTQKKFIQVFSQIKEPYLLVRETEGLTYRLFETLLFLMETFFQLPFLEEEVQESRKKDVLLVALMEQFAVEQRKYSQMIYVSYHLVGPLALKRWIKQEVESVLAKAGLHLVDVSHFTHPGLVRHVRVTNKTKSSVIAPAIDLPYWPSQEMIRHGLTAFL